MTGEQKLPRKRIRFDPLPLFRRTLWYATIQMAEVGPGVNLRSRDGVVVHWRHGGLLRLGTDDVENLAPLTAREERWSEVTGPLLRSIR
jgi:hypothetical protein